MRNPIRKTPFNKKKDDGFVREVRKKTCRFCLEKATAVDYKDINRLQRYVTAKGKIVSRRLSGNCAKHQRKLGAAIKRARFIALMSYTKI